MMRSSRSTAELHIAVHCYKRLIIEVRDEFGCNNVAISVQYLYSITWIA